MNPVINTQSALMPTKQFIDQNGKPVDRHNFYNGQPRKGSSPEKILLGKRSVKTTQKRANTPNINNDECTPPAQKRKRKIPPVTELFSIGNGLEISSSSLIKSGRGTFITVKGGIKCDEFITWYDGEVEALTLKDRQALLASYEKWSHAAAVCQYVIIQGLQSPQQSSGGGSFINDSFNQPFHPYNCKFVQLPDSNTIYIKAIKDIAEGDELFINYGKLYWLRFRDEFPDIYDDILKSTILTKGRLHEILSLQTPSGDLSKVVELMQEYPVPHYTEFKSTPEQWTPEVVRYVMVKTGVKPSNFLNRYTLRILRPDSEQYFRAVGLYATSQKNMPEDMSQNWNQAGLGLKPLPVPTTIFKPAQRWTSAHFYVLFRKYKPEHPFNRQRLKLCLSVLKPDEETYAQTLKDFVRDHSFKNGQPLFPGKIKYNLTRALKDIPLPIRLDQKTFAKRYRTHSKHGEKLRCWPAEAIADLLKAVGRPTKRFDKSYPRIIVKLNQLCIDGKKDGYRRYYQLFEAWVTRNQFNFAQMSSEIKRQMREAGIEENSKSGLIFPQTRGLKIHQGKCDITRVFLAYVYKFGFDDHRIFNHLNNETIYKALALFKHPIAKHLMELHANLWTVAYSRIKRSDVALEALNNHKDIDLPESLELFSNKERHNMLRKDGLKLIKKTEGKQKETVTSLKVLLIN